MLKESKAISSWSVNDLAAAKKFYIEVLGLDVADGKMGTLDLQMPGGGTIWVYPKPNHEPATFTVVNFLVVNIDETVDGLTRLGVKFEQYHTQYMETDVKGIARGGGEKGPTIAWFRDPAGNFMSIVQES